MKWQAAVKKLQVGWLDGSYRLQKLQVAGSPIESKRKQKPTGVKELNEILTKKQCDLINEDLTTKSMWK